MNVTLDADRLDAPKSDRNSGRTFDALVSAVFATKEFRSVAFVTACDSEVTQLGRDIAIICEYYQLPFLEKASRREFVIGDSTLFIVNANYGQGRGCRAHFVLDHSCAELLLPAQFKETVAAIYYAHAGSWPPIGAESLTPPTREVA